MPSSCVYNFVMFKKIEIHIFIEFLLHDYRFHGTRIAEMPFIATEMAYRGQGVCQELMRVIESVSENTNVTKLLVIYPFNHVVEIRLRSFNNSFPVIVLHRNIIYA